ncbi:MAG: ParA family protein [Desulfuromonadales bacterium]
MKRPFIVTVASEKGGVGKTTIATNLAVYLKALREDLPVTIASFDNHFSVDQMFALGPHPDQGVAMLFDGVPPSELVTLGQYGVQYLASARRLTTPGHPPGWLRQLLHSAHLEGILVLDTRPIFDWFTEAAVLAADLVLLPVKDRAALFNAETVRQALTDAGRADRLWLVPSLVDSRARLNAEVRVHEFLTYAARERDHQVLDTWISKSPKVESLASGFSSRIKPVLTHARNTAVHGQLKALSEFVLSRFENQTTPLERPVPSSMSPGGAAETAVNERRLVLECPVCCRQSFPGNGHYYFDLRSRQRGFLHPACFTKLSEEMNLEEFDSEVDLIALTIEGPGLIGPECRLSVHLCSVEEGVTGVTSSLLGERQHLGDSLAYMTGRPLNEAYRELILVKCTDGDAEQQISVDAARDFAGRRRRAARDLRLAGLF